MKKTKLIFIGYKFYFESGTMMSSIYTEDGQRYDWGFVQRDLQNGIPVDIRPATDAEFAKYQRILDSRKK